MLWVAKGPEVVVVEDGWGAKMDRWLEMLGSLGLVGRKRL